MRKWGFYNSDYNYNPSTSFIWCSPCFPAFPFSWVSSSFLLALDVQFPSVSLVHFHFLWKSPLVFPALGRPLYISRDFLVARLSPFSCSRHPLRTVYDTLIQHWALRLGHPLAQVSSQTCCRSWRRSCT